MNIVCVPAQLCDPMDCSQPHSFGHEVVQARILECIAISYSRGSSQPRDQMHFSCVSCIRQADSYHCTTWEAPVDSRVHRSGSAGSYGRSVFSCFFFKKLYTTVHNGYTNYLPIISAGASPFLHTLSSIYCFQILLLIAILTGVK